MGLPGLVGSDKERVQRDNDAAEFVLSELQHAHDRGVGSVRENPHNSLHWCTPTEVRMFSTRQWWDHHYHACCLQATRRKSQRLRHDIEEIERWPQMQCRHFHSRTEWDPQHCSDGSTWYPSKEEAEYTAALVFHIAVAVS